MERYMGRNGYSIAAVAALLLGLAGCGGGNAAGNEPAVETPEVVLAPQDVAVAQRSQISSSVMLTGSLDPHRVVEVRAQVPGTLSGLRVDRGQPVRRGEVMAVIEAEGIRSQAAGARAGVAAAEANLALAQQQLEGARTLYEAGAMSEIDFRSTQAAYEAAQAQLAAARAQAAGAGEQARRATVEAPISGEVSNREVSEGEAVSPGQTLFTVVNTDFLELAGQVPANQAAQVRVGQPVEFTLSAYPGRVFQGEVARVESTADPATRQVGVYVRLPNRDHGLVGGLFATGRILAGTQDDVLVVPAGAVREAGGETFAWVVADGVAERRPVTVGARDASRGVVSVTSGLREGEQVVVAPGRLEEGARVQIGAATSEVEEG